MEWQRDRIYMNKQPTILHQSSELIDYNSLFLLRIDGILCNDRVGVFHIDRQFHTTSHILILLLHNRNLLYLELFVCCSRKHGEHSMWTPDVNKVFGRIYQERYTFPIIMICKTKTTFVTMSLSIPTLRKNKSSFSTIGVIVKETVVNLEINNFEKDMFQYVLTHIIHFDFSLYQ